MSKNSLYKETIKVSQSILNLYSIYKGHKSFTIDSVKEVEKLMDKYAIKVSDRR